MAQEKKRVIAEFSAEAAGSAWKLAQACVAQMPGCRVTGFRDTATGKMVLYLHIPEGYIPGEQEPARKEA